jgi:excisionase family DNA binding protein
MAHDVLTTDEAAAYLRVSAFTLKRKARAGDIPAAKAGRAWRFLREDLDKWLRNGGDLRQRLEDEGLLMAMDEAKADPANRTSRPLEEVLRERGL